MSIFFETLIEQGFALVYNVDVLLLSNSKEHMFQRNDQFHIEGRKQYLELAWKINFHASEVEILGREIGYEIIEPIHSKIVAFHNIFSPTGKVALMSFIGELKFEKSFLEKLQIKS